MMTRHGGSVQQAPSFETLAGKQRLPDPPWILPWRENSGYQIHRGSYLGGKTAATRSTVDPTFGGKTAATRSTVAR
jgi:hypothetical protein